MSNVQNLKGLFALLLVVMLASAFGCRREGPAVQYDANKHKMRQLLAHVSQIKFEKKADNFNEALAIVKRENPDLVKMYGVEKRLLLNPDWQLYDVISSNEFAVVTEVPVVHY
ncbi:MAG: hypothetical protein K0Q55_1183, partial [Verrucomicrobia bacterium]|nr:hypothetical protein [Verrucomicrobiota bacterium]